MTRLPRRTVPALLVALLGAVGVAVGAALEGRLDLSGLGTGLRDRDPR